jgi:hypothetical protein
LRLGLETRLHESGGCVVMEVDLQLDLLLDSGRLVQLDL